MEPRTLRERDGGLVNHWYIACTSSELRQERPLKRVLYEAPYVLFRDASGRPACLPDRCLHRAAQLSAGRVGAGELECPYHGWRYDRSGRVVDIPSEGPQARAKAGEAGIRRLCLPARPCVEQDGAVWVWMGDAEHAIPSPAAPPWRFPHRGEPGWAHYFMITDFGNEVTHLVENFMDVPHTTFVHAGWFRRRTGLRVPITLKVAGGSVVVTYRQARDRIGFTAKLLNPRGEPMRHTDRFIFPNITCVTYDFGSSRSFVINSQCTPVGPLNTRVYTWIAFRMGRLTRLARPLMQRYTRQVIEQDVAIMKNQGESLRIDPSTDFRSTDADEIHLAIERLRELGVRGDPAAYGVAKHRERAFWI
jgi:phenylpropionate dioxygenase-like ring-hydroxylating dioxygenase large terminal subunit